MIKLLKKLFSKNVVSWDANKAPIVEAFIIAGRKFYQFENVENPPYERGLKCITYYEELRMKCSYEYLKAHAEAVDNLLKQKTIDVFAIKKLNDQIKDRLTWITDTDLIYKLASVVFFDANENPYEYDFAYNKKKVEFWKQNASMSDFFLSMPMQKLVPFLKDVEVNLENYSKATEQMNIHHWQNLFNSKSSN